MARKLRVESAGECYHVLNRGNYPWRSFRLFPRVRRPPLLEPEVILRESGG